MRGLPPNYDRWKTTPPEPEEIVVDYCAYQGCGDKLQAGREVYRDSRGGEHFCGRDCFRAFLKSNLDESLDELIDKLEADGDTEFFELEAIEQEPPEPDPDIYDY